MPLGSIVGCFLQYQVIHGLIFCGNTYYLPAPDPPHPSPAHAYRVRLISFDPVKKLAPPVMVKVVINAMEHYPDMRLLIMGRLLGGISTSLLFTAFESWMVSEHRKEGETGVLRRIAYYLCRAVNWPTVPILKSPTSV